MEFSNIESIEGIDIGHAENIAQGVQFGMVQFRQLGQAAFAGRQQVDVDLAAVDLAVAAFDQSELFATRDQRNDAVMLGLQALGKLADAGPVTAGSAFYMQQQ